MKFNATLLKAAADYHAGHGVNPLGFANAVVTVRWPDGLQSKVSVADYEHYPLDFEASVTAQQTFVGPDGQLWHRNVLGFAHAPELCTVTYGEDYPIITVRPEMFCGRVGELIA